MMGAVVDVDFPDMIGDDDLEAGLVDEGPQAKVSQELVGLGERDLVLVLSPGQAGPRALDGQDGAILGAPNSHGVAVSRQIALSDLSPGGRVIAPGLTDHQELAFDFDAHHLPCR